jgi:hypothetical protein
MQDYYLEDNDWDTYFAPGEMAERSNAAVLKTVEVKASGGSNPSLSAENPLKQRQRGFLLFCYLFLIFLKKNHPEF